MQSVIREVSHLNSATLKPFYPRLTGIIWCILVEHTAGYVLVDTGIGTQDFTHPCPMMRLFSLLLRIRSDPQQAIVSQLKALGVQASDVNHIVLTHTHLDHAGGLPDFPHAQVHIYAAEYKALQHPRALLDNGHIKAHFAHNPDWVFHSDIDTQWFGFDAIAVLPGILLVPLPGHTSGHCGVAVQTGDGWILHAGDAISPFHAASDPDRRGASRDYPMKWIPDAFAYRILGNHTERIAKLLNTYGDEVTVISAHDNIAFQQLTGETA